MSAWGEPGGPAPVAALRRWSRGLRARRHARRLAGAKLLRAFARRYPRATFIQIGANDGSTDDVLAPFITDGEWSGILVEPLPEPFERLRRAHAGREDRLTLVNAAVSHADGRVPVYYPCRVSDGEVVDRLDTLASLSRETAERTGAAFVADGEREIAEAEVDAVSLGSLVREHSVTQLDLLAIDTEGHDYEVVRQVDLEGLRPRLLVYEHLLLSSRDRERCAALVSEAGYETLAEQKDTWCLDPRDDELTRRFRSLTPAAPAESIGDWET